MPYEQLSSTHVALQYRVFHEADLVAVLVGHWQAIEIGTSPKNPVWQRSPERVVTEHPVPT